jgi:UDP-N-acetylglucosamine 2-epimerase (non-hydrolysing)
MVMRISAPKEFPTIRIKFVGNIMIDSLLSNLERARSSTIRTQLGLAGKPYSVLTLHRPSNVDDRETFTRIVTALEGISERIPSFFQPIRGRRE